MKKFRDWTEDDGTLKNNTQVQFKADGQSGGVVQGGAYRSLISYAAPRGSGALWQQDWFDNYQLRIAE
jgi:hypothetical protein